MTISKLRELKTIDDVARACGVEADFITEYAESPEQSTYYEALKLSKKGKRRSNEFRIVFAAHEQRLKQLHRGLSMVVANSANFGWHVQGFVKGRSTLSNAKQHLGAKVLLHADIKSFFDAITVDQVQAAFVEHGVLAPMAEVLAKLCTIDGLLRQGTRCSPMIANLVCFDMDQAFLRLAGATNSNYTRYADDITFSGDSVPSDDSVRTILKNRSFELRDGRCFRQHRGRVQFVTGLSVADTTAPRLPKRLKHQLRLVMYFIKKHGLDDHNNWVKQGYKSHPEITWLWGILNYAKSIEPTLVNQWQQVYQTAWEEQQAKRKERIKVKDWNP
ncbi:reverse transcriptase family protein [Aquabacterium sp. CECT 9606]|uniref:reverse transcriptase family protein n=1 Tax=Aquabacterium sp. CECT 9606 TaxID=2845822 RepID=UPI001E64DEA4|nr:reverse transcriptase family protein [Aquabacterium sp. CECT 9606]